VTAGLRELLEQRVRSGSDTVALVGPEGPVTWAQLSERATRVAAGLVRDGVAPQDRVVYLGKNDVRFFDVLFGCALAGAIPTPLNWRLAPRELAAIIEDSGARIAFADPDAAGAVAQVETVVELTGLERWWGPAEDPGVPADPEHIAFQLYTSGTTGRPKGAMFANGTNLRVLLDDISVEWGFGPGDVSLLCMPLFHMGGVAWALAGMARGARSVVVRDFEPTAVLDTMERERVTAAFCVPAMLAALCAVPGIDARRLHLRRMIYSGSPISTTALTAAMKALRCDFVQIYGLTEATGAFAQLPAADHDPGGPRADLLRSAGRPYPWVEIRVVSTTDGADRPPGGIGEIWTRSAQNLVGYWNQPEETARALTADGWLRTGDLGYLDADGRIFLVDRAKDLIISGGENVYPVEVENVLAAHPALAEVAVIGVPDERWGETVRAIVVARPGVEVDAADVIAFAREQLAKFKCPAGVDVVATLSRTATGKVLKAELREPYWRGHDRRIN
jgi:acyl-CoA synthetase (AMP-forming)/AMP-acid ligase II